MKIYTYFTGVIYTYININIDINIDIDIDIDILIYIPRKMNMSPKKGPFWTGNFILQPSIFAGQVSLQRGICRFIIIINYNIYKNMFYIDMYHISHMIFGEFVMEVV